MAGLKTITELEKSYSELVKIRKQIDTLEEFLVFAINENRVPDRDSDPGIMIDPRTGKEFKPKSGEGTGKIMYNAVLSPFLKAEIIIQF